MWARPAPVGGSRGAAPALLGWAPAGARALAIPRKDSPEARIPSDTEH